MKKNKQKKSKIKLFFGIFILLIILACLGACVYFFYIDPNRVGKYQEGILGWFQTIFLYLAITVLVLIVLFLISRRILHHHPDEKKSIRFLSVIICLVPGILLGIFLLGSSLLDVRYMANPRTGILRNVEIEQIRSSEGSFYQISGTDQDGNPQNFRINKSTYQTLSSDTKPFATLTYLPSTHILMSVQTDDAIDQSILTSMTLKNETGDDWKALKVQINKDLYQIPSTLQDWIDTGWTIDASTPNYRSNMQIDAHRSFTLYILSADGLRAEVLLENQGEEACAPEQATITRITLVDNDSGMNVQFSKDVSLGWSSKDGVIDLYGEPTSQEDHVLTYSQDGASMVLTFDEANILESVSLISGQGS